MRGVLAVAEVQQTDWEVDVVDLGDGFSLAEGTNALVRSRPADRNGAREND